MKKLFLSFFIFSINVFFLGCKKDTKETNPTIEVTLVNMGFSAWRVVSVQNSSNFGVLDMNNTPFTFIRGRRYRIISMANVAVHPFEFRNTMNLPVLSQNQMNMGSLATDESINFVSDANSISFTVSKSFESNVATYNCANHNGMKGDVFFE